MITNKNIPICRSRLASVITTAILASTLCGCVQGKAARSEAKHIFGANNRQLVTSDQPPWSTIGQVEARGRELCTGTLISERHVLTAAHCVLDLKRKKLKDILFYPPMPNDDPFVKDEVYGVSLVDWGSNEPLTNNSTDWAILTLEGTPGKTYGWTSLRRTTIETIPERISAAGYSHDVDHGRTASVDLECSVKEREANFVTSDCDFLGGASGGPALAWTGQHYEIVGLIHAQIEYGNGQSYHPEYNPQTPNLIIPTFGAFDRFMTVLGR